MIRTIRPAQLEQHCVCGVSRERGRAQAQRATFTGANANDVVGEDFGMPVFARGDVDNQAGCHKVTEPKAALDFILQESAAKELTRIAYVVLALTRRKDANLDLI